MIALAAEVLAGCSGASHAVAPATDAASAAATAAPKSTVSIKVKITDPASVAASAVRAPQFVSPSIDGLLAQVYVSPQSSNPTVVGTSATDVSPGSAACGGQTGTRTCTITVPAPAGTDDFVFTAYNMPPVGNSFAGAATLSIGSLVGAPIVANATNTVNVALSGVISSLSLSVLSVSPSSASFDSYPLTIGALDAGGNNIVAGAMDPYENPITVSVSESGGSGFTFVSLNGGANSTSVSVTQSSQSVNVVYESGSPSGYSATVTESASGVTPVTALSISPIFNGNATVTNLTDSGPGSLRAALAAAGSGTTINVPLTGTIQLASTLVIPGGVSVIGLGAGSLTILGDGTDRVMSSSSPTPSMLSGMTINGGAGGGIVVNSGATLSLFGVTLTGNAPSSPAGGGLYSYPGSVVTVTNSTIVNNSNPNGGSGAGIYNGGTMTVNQSTFAGNSQPNGGFGAALYSIGTLTVTNSTFSGNTSSAFTGGLFNQGQATVLMSTFVNNTGIGSDIYSNLAGNSISIGQSISTGTIYAENSAQIVSLDYNVLGGTMVAGNGGTVTGSFANTVYPSSLGNFNLGTLGSNGGQTQTVPLLAGSPAIDLIPTYLCASLIDQRGVTRPQGAGCDAGAFEY